MPSVGPAFLILGLVVASAVANQTTDSNVNKENLSNNSSNVTHPVTITTTSITNTATTNITSSNDTGIFPDNFAITDDTNITDVSSTTNPSTTRQEDSDDESSNGGEGVSQNATVSVTTPAPFTSPKSKTATSTTDRNKHTTTSPARRGSGDTIGISILVVIIAVAVVFVIACCFLRKRRERRYSVDLTSRPDEANIPLSTVEPELHIDSVSQNGLQTFENTATTKKESQEPEAKPEVQEEQKAEADKSVVDPSAESAAPRSSEDKPKQVDTEQSLPAPVELSMEEKTDDEGIVSNKTSVESLKEKNESSNNKAGLTGGLYFRFVSLKDSFSCFLLYSQTFHSHTVYSILIYHCVFIHSAWRRARTRLHVLSLQKHCVGSCVDKTEAVYLLFISERQFSVMCHFNTFPLSVSQKQ